MYIIFPTKNNGENPDFFFQEASKVSYKEMDKDVKAEREALLARPCGKMTEKLYADYRFAKIVQTLNTRKGK